MGLLDRFRSPPPELSAERLLGCWHLISHDETDADVDMEFVSDGRLTYAIDGGDRWQVMRLTFRVEGNTIVSDQPSAPREERTRFRFGTDGSLILEQNGSETRFRRGQPRAPDV